MTISSEPVPLNYNGDDSTVDFPITWKYFSTSDVRVTHRSAAGVETTWALNTDYTLTAAGDDDGGTLTATTAPATGTSITIELDTPNTQPSSFPLGGGFPSQDVEDAIDRLTQICAKLEQLFNRSLRVPRTDDISGSNLELPIDSDRANNFLAFDSNGTPIASVGTTSDFTPVSSFIDTLLDDADAVTACKTLLAVHVLNKDVSVNTVTGTVVETTVYSFELPANTLGTNKAVRITLHYDVTAGSGNGFVIRLKYGSTTLTTTAEIGSSTTDSPGGIGFIIYNDGATDSQKAICISLGASNTFVTIQSLTSAEDSTTALNIVITAQADTATGTTLDVHGVFTELLT